jgi:hypothetical protein
VNTVMSKCNKIFQPSAIGFAYVIFTLLHTSAIFKIV